MENDPFEIWREAVDEIERQQLLDEYEIAEFNGPLTPTPAQAAYDFMRTFENLLGDDMDEEKQVKDKFIRALAVVRGFTFLILISVIGLLTIALVADWINGTEFIAASIVWFGMGVLFLWGTEFVKKEQENGKKENTEAN